jgi:hypothetical protein
MPVPASDMAYHNIAGFYATATTRRTQRSDKKFHLETVQNG